VTSIGKEGFGGAGGVGEVGEVGEADIDRDERTVWTADAGVER
jgi:hypothetical protein